MDNIKAVNRTEVNSLKWNGEFIKRMGLINDYNDQTIPMWVADMDLRVAVPIEEALINTAKQGSFGYTTTMEDNQYYEACINYFKRHYNHQVSARDIFMAPGTLHTIKACIKTFTKEGDGVIIQRPVYTQFTTQIESAKRVVKDNHLIYDNGNYLVDFENLEELASQNENKLMILCNPHNPVGKMFTKEELERIADICQRHNVVICSDEVHAGIIKLGSTHTPIATVSTSKNIITCTDFGKTFNTASLHVCNVICKNHIHAMRLKMNGAAPQPSSFAINAVKAAYNDCDGWIENLNKHITNNKEYIADFIEKNLSKLKYKISDATYFAWLDFTEYKLGEKELNRLIRDECNLVLEHGGMFASDHLEFQRMVIACPFETVVEAMNRIKNVFTQYE